MVGHWSLPPGWRRGPDVLSAGDAGGANRPITVPTDAATVSSARTAVRVSTASRLASAAIDLPVGSNATSPWCYRPRSSAPGSGGDSSGATPWQVQATGVVTITVSRALQVVNTGGHWGTRVRTARSAGEWFQASVGILDGRNGVVRQRPNHLDAGGLNPTLDRGAVSRRHAAQVKESVHRDPAAWSGTRCRCRTACTAEGVSAKEPLAGRQQGSNSNPCGTRQRDGP